MPPVKRATRERAAPFRLIPWLLLLICLFLWPAERQRRSSPHEAATTVFEEPREGGSFESGIAALLDDDGSQGAASQAAAFFQDAIDDFQSRGESGEEGAARYGLALSFLRLGREAEARSSLETAYRQQINGGDLGGAARSANRLALMKLANGELDAALRLFDRAATLFRIAGDAVGESDVLYNLGNAYREAGEAHRAARALRRSLEAEALVAGPFARAETLNALALVLAEVGDFEQAKRNVEEALDGLEGSFDQAPRQSTTLARLHNSLALVLVEIGSLDSAQTHAGLALELFTAAADAAGIAAVQTNLGLIALEGGRLRDSQQWLGDAARACRQIGDRRCEGVAWLHRGRASRQLGRSGQAQLELERALRLFRTVGYGGGEENALAALALLSFERGALLSAKATLEAVLEQVELRRSRLYDPLLRASLLSSQRSRLDLYIAILLALDQAQPDKGYGDLALVAQERWRARSLAELLAEASPPTAWSDVDGELVARERALRWRISVLSNRSGQARQLEQANEEYRQWLADLRARAPRYATLVAPEPLGLFDTQDFLHRQGLDDTLVLAYHLAETSSVLFAIHSRGFVIKDLDSRSVIDGAAVNLVSKLGRSRERIFRGPAMVAAEQLSSLVLGPVKDVLREARFRQLVLVTDGALNAVPFAALPVPDEPGQKLIDRWDLSSQPSLTVWQRLRAAPRSRDRRKGGEVSGHTLAIFSNPRYISASNQKTSAAAPSPLPGSQLEGTRLMALLPQEEVWLAQGAAASRKNLLEGRAASYRYLHLATHARVSTQNPQDSGILLATADEEGREVPGFLSWADLYRLELDADLVVLSGCETALGKGLDSEGIVGLARGFFYAGARSLLASLWRIDDEATADLMEAFYRALLVEGTDPASALRQAQNTMRVSRRWTSPFYWAGFVVIGDPGSDVTGAQASEQEVANPVLEVQGLKGERRPTRARTTPGDPHEKDQSLLHSEARLFRSRANPSTAAAALGRLPRRSPGRGRSRRRLRRWRSSEARAVASRGLSIGQRR